MLLSFVTLHDYHVSRIEIESNPDEKRFEITMFVFLDDLELALEQRGHETQHICTKMELPTADSLMLDYISSVFRISRKGKSIALNYLGKQLSDDLSGAYIYLYSDRIDISKDYALKTSLLTEIYADQTNMVSWKDKKGKISYFTCNARKEDVALRYE